MADRLRWALAGAALLFAACGRASGPLELARAFDPAAIEALAGRAPLFPDTERVVDADGDWLRVAVGRGERTLAPSRLPGVLRALVPPIALLYDRAPTSRAPRLVRADGRAYRFVEWMGLETAPAGAFAPGDFTAMGEELWIVDDGELADAELVLDLPIARGQREGGAWRVVLGQLTGDGIELWPGEAWNCALPDGPARRLDFVFAAHAFEPGLDATLTWTVALDGRELARGVFTAEPQVPTWRSASVELGKRAGRLRFAVEGQNAHAAFLVPRVVAADAERSRRPDAAIFLADTFRADLLGLDTGAGSLTPHLDAFRAAGVHFVEARSPASWTLPAHASLFTTLQPASHGAIGHDDRITPNELFLAQRLRELGYRTIALTNGVFVSRGYGMDRGFELFYEERRSNDVEGLLDRLETLLAHPDERPLFVFLHTYRAHDPYRVEEATLARLGGPLGIQRDFAQLVAALEATGHAWNSGEPVAEGTDGELAELQALYRGGAADVDRGFGRWQELLARAGRDDVLLFLSDHGEAFGLRDRRIGHRLGPFEDQLRVPFVVRAPGLAPAAVRGPATLMDVPRTLFALLDLPPLPRWRGRALLGAGAAPLRADEPIALLSEVDEIAFVEGARKVIARGERLDERLVFDLASDPHELAPTDAHRAWAEARIAGLLADTAWRQPLLMPGDVALSPAHAAQLGDLGYTDG